MPGKINPVLPETLNQLYFLVSGNNQTIEKAAEASQMELGVMLPVIADRLLESIQLSAQAIKQFDKLCVARVKADVKKCREHLEKSTAYATLFTPRLGYDLVSGVVAEAIKTNRTFREVAVERKLLSNKEFESVIKRFHF